MSQDNRPPYETFKGPTCRGSLIFGTACGHCEKCDWERARLAGRTPTNPPVPATPLDVEEWVRLLDDLIVMLAPHDAQSIADANQLRALASALPGMGKDSDEFREACRAGGIACAGEREAARDEGRLDDARRWGRFAEILHARVGANR